MNSVGLRQTETLLRLYYGATVLFLLLDYLLGINVRVVPLSAYPGWRALYYVFCFGCLALMFWRPLWSSAIALVESLLTLSMLIIAMWMRVAVFSDAMLDGGADPLTGKEIVNFMLSGSAAWVAYFRGMQSVERKIRDE